MSPLASWLLFPIIVAGAFAAAIALEPLYGAAAALIIALAASLPA